MPVQLIGNTMFCCLNSYYGKVGMTDRCKGFAKIITIRAIVSGKLRHP